MSTIYEPPIAAGSGQIPSQPAWPGLTDPGRPGDPVRESGSPGGPGRHSGHRLLQAGAVAGAAVVAGLGTFWGLQATGSTTGAVLTTAQIAAKVDPDLA